jgi:hypothetical protein
MKLNNRELYDFLHEKNIEVLYHANTVRTSMTYFEQNGLLSRGAVESHGLEQTEQSSDDADKILNVWDDVFIDTTDLHSFFSRQNHYGPVLFEFNIDLLLNEDYDIWITKDNPIYWNVDTTDENRYFISVEELREKWDDYARQKKMITIRNNSKPILFEYVRRVIVDDPRITILKNENEKIHVFNETFKNIKSKIGETHILKEKFLIRVCTNCWCRENYLNEVNVNEIKRLFL